MVRRHGMSRNENNRVHNEELTATVLVKRKVVSALATRPGLKGLKGLKAAGSSSSTRADTAPTRAKTNNN